MKKPAAKTSWEKVSGWYSDHLAESGNLITDVVYPGTIRLLAAQPATNILDIACGEGSFGRKLVAASRVKVTGIDAAPSLIRLAQQKAGPHETYRTAPASGFTHLVKSNMFEGAVCLLALQNIDPIGPVFKEAFRALKPKRPLVIVMNHPSFRQPKSSGWEYDEKKQIQYRKVDRYMTPYREAITTHPGSAPYLKTFSFHRPLQTYAQELAANGFMIDVIEEWISNKTSTGRRANAENTARKEIPLFLAIRAISLRP